MNFSEILVELADDFSFAFLNKIGLSYQLKTNKLKEKYAEVKVMIPIVLENDLKDLRKYTIFLGILPKDKFEKELEKEKEAEDIDG